MRMRLFVLACLLAVVVVLPAHATNSLLGNFRSAYPAAAGTRIDSCTLCHTSAPSLNSYGSAYKAAGENFAGIASADSDGDGFTNLAEITALTFPGNASDKPAAATGSLTVTLAPAGAVTAGAQWRVGAALYESGATATGLAAGSVTVQFTAVAGWTAPADQTVTITGGQTTTATGIYTQPQTQVSVPDVVGLAQAAASAAITGADLVVGTVTQQYSETVPSGTVISQTPAAGATASPGSAVGLVVSQGPQPVPVPAPNVVGLTEDAAAIAIETAGLVVGQITETPSDTVPAGEVISQNPAAGQQVAPGSAVSLTLSSGPDAGGCACFGGQKSTFSADGLLKMLGDLFMVGLSLITLQMMSRRKI